MHKFESHYILNLVGKIVKNPMFIDLVGWFVTLFPLIAGSEAGLFERSPINFVEKFSCPIILFQGLEDTVCNSYLFLAQLRYSFFMANMRNIFGNVLYHHLHFVFIESIQFIYISYMSLDWLTLLK